MACRLRGRQIYNNKETEMAVRECRRLISTSTKCLNSRLDGIYIYHCAPGIIFETN